MGAVGGTTGIGEDEEDSEDWKENHVLMVFKKTQSVVLPLLPHSSLSSPIPVVDVKLT